MRFHVALMLKEKRHRINHRQILRMIAAQPRLRRSERKLRGEWIHHRQRTQQTLGIAVERFDLHALTLRVHAVQRAAFALRLLNRRRLRRFFIDGQHQTAVE